MFLKVMRGVSALVVAERSFQVRGSRRFSGMKREVPLEVAFLLRAAVEVVEERPSRESLLRVAAGITNVPVMLEAQVKPGARRNPAQRRGGDARGAQVILGEFLH